MPPVRSRKHEKIFERFYQVTNHEGKTYPGLGIELYISHEIVRRHDGQIWVESRKGGGAIFSVALPFLSNEEDSVLSEREEETKSDVGGT